MAEEPLNGLLLGLAEQAVLHPEKYRDHHWFVVEDFSEVKLAALVSPMNLVLSHGDAGCLEPLAFHLLDGSISPKGVVGPSVLADAFKDHWTLRRGVRARLAMNQGMYCLREVVWPPKVPGRARLAGPEDRAILKEWTFGFSQDAHLSEALNEAKVAERVEHRLLQKYLFIWEVEGTPVAMASLGRPSENGFTVNLVYTPKEHRGHGYASSLTAHVSQEALNRGKQFCVLYTDLLRSTLICSGPSSHLWATSLRSSIEHFRRNTGDTPSNALILVRRDLTQI